MSLLNQKDTIKKALEEVYAQNKELSQSIKSLVEYIDLEVYTKDNEEDLHVTNLIGKKVDLFCKKIIEKLKEDLEESELIEIKISKDGIYEYEPIAYIYGSKVEEEGEKFKFKKSHINSYLDDENSFLIIVDASDTFKISPWKI